MDEAEKYMSENEDEIKAELEALLDEIESAEKSVADIGAQLEPLDEERVTIFMEEDIDAIKSEQAEKFIEVINNPKEYFSLRFFYLIWDCLN